MGSREKVGREKLQSLMFSREKVGREKLRSLISSHENGVAKNFSREWMWSRLKILPW